MTYAQFEKKAKNVGLYDSFSQADLELARKDPSAGMQILGYKIDYNNATTDEARELANANAESVRSSAGYFGGKDGSGYKKAGDVVPSSFGYTYGDVVQKAQDAGVYGQISELDMEQAKRNPDYGMATVYNKIGYNSAATPEDAEKYHQAQEELRSSLGGYTGGADGSGFIKNPLSPRDFSYKEYESEHEKDVSDLYGQIRDYKDFSYNAEEDPLYAQYVKQYRREGQRATEDVMGQAAAMTGGIPSSYAATAAAQAGNYYAAQLTDKIPELYQLAYNQYMNEFNMLGDKLKMAQGLEETDYARYLDGKNFSYGKHIDEINNQKIGRDEALQSELLADDRAYRDKVFENDTAYRDKVFENDTAYREKEFAANQGALTFEQKYNIARMAAAEGDWGPMNALAKEYNIQGWTDIAPVQAASGGGTGEYSGSTTSEQGGVATSWTEELKQKYPNGVIPKEVWDVYAGVYGADNLTAEGFKKANLITNILDVFA